MKRNGLVEEGIDVDVDRFEGEVYFCFFFFFDFIYGGVRGGGWEKEMMRGFLFRRKIF